MIAVMQQLVMWIVAKDGMNMSPKELPYSLRLCLWFCAEKFDSPIDAGQFDWQCVTASFPPLLFFSDELQTYRMHVACVVSGFSNLQKMFSCLNDPIFKIPDCSSRIKTPTTDYFVFKK